ncbi:thioredoxin domain protein [Formosa agariphila KMM 3901]|uniref:Thioredoxin domain protein n=1 Tax=Formosa agariphila (strain DSM 15362 / KCTC 12365 / LMG 23005 / KMM 3901 / M-2Alg 35-1) TaxID=1347342 RepID=T2KS34_FORAG|nr:thioredoxin family protein [Formosa agariphila]CDF80924.1 thioredoxin domain protein [Formosa agariphila KMM 3901]
MEITHSKVKNEIIQKGLERAMSYQDFRDLVKALSKTGGTTGAAQTEDFVGYTKVNESRMKRWDKTLKVSETATEAIQNFKGNQTWLVIAESWCGDAAHVLPIINKVSELNENIELRVVLRDENEALMDMFLTNGGKSIPKMIVIDNTTGEVVNTFGPRPKVATKFVADYKAEHGVLTPEFKESLQTWYNLDKGQSTITDLLELLGV